MSLARDRTFEAESHPSLTSHEFTEPLFFILSKVTL